MSTLYDRKYRLVIGVPKTIIYDTNTLNLDTINTYVREDYVSDYRFEQGQAVEITDLQIEADIAGKSNTGNQAGCVLKIYNLSDETRSIIEQNNNYLILEAGYAQDEELALIFSGQVFDYVTEKQGHDMVTTLKCKDGYTPNNGIRVAKKFAKGGNYGEVLTSLTSIFAANGIPVGYLELSPKQDEKQLFTQIFAPSEIILLRGYSAVGFLRQIMDNVCNSIGYVWYITNGRLFCHPKGFTKTIEEYEFNTDQMISIRKTGNQQMTTSTGKGDDGIRIITFLDGRLDTDKRIKVEDGTYQGDYKIVAKSHSLNYRNGQRITTIDCKKA